MVISENNANGAHSTCSKGSFSWGLSGLPLDWVKGGKLSYSGAKKSNLVSLWSIGRRTRSRYPSAGRTSTGQDANLPLDGLSALQWVAPMKNGQTWTSRLQKSCWNLELEAATVKWKLLSQHPWTFRTFIELTYRVSYCWESPSPSGPTTRILGDLSICIIKVSL